jgi:hypothetical protein
MNYEQLIETVSLIIDNPKINKNGLSLLYELPTQIHNSLNEAIFKKANPYSNNFVPNDEFDLDIAGINIKFKKINLDS